MPAQAAAIECGQYVWSPDGRFCLWETICGGLPIGALTVQAAPKFGFDPRGCILVRHSDGYAFQIGCTVAEASSAAMQHLRLFVRD
eukprot:15458153-Alexandrium_andersonii.AAC.1